VPTILKLEQKALKWLEDKPDQLPKFASILKQKKQVAGILSQDLTVVQPTINIKEVANLMLNVSQDNAVLDGNKEQVNTDNMQRADVIDISSG
jgi:AICAR transformylase/IMP cyclohydrolase PurH